VDLKSVFSRSLSVRGRRDGKKGREEGEGGRFPVRFVVWDLKKVMK
jgi:hypothetical protein